MKLKKVLTMRSLRNLMLINLLFGMTESLFALRTVFLSTRGMTPDQVGLVFSLSSVVGTLSPLIGGMLADRLRSRYRVFLAATAGYAVVVALLPLSAQIRIGSMLLAMVLMPTIQVFHPAGSTLIATCSINAAYSNDGVDYSMLRIWMSIGYTAANFAFTPIMRTLGVDAPFYIALLAFAGIFFLRKSVKEYENAPTLPADGETGARDGRLNFRGIFRNYYIVTFIVINVIYSAAGNCSMYLSYVLDDRGIDPSQIGVVAAVKVLGEVAVLLLIPRMKKLLSLSGLQILAGLFLCAELTLIPAARSLGSLCLLEMLGGVGNGISLCTAGLYVRTMAPRGLEATAQSLWSMGSSLGGVVLSYVFGRIVGAYGVTANYRVALALEGTWVVLFAATLLVGRFVLKKKNAVPMLFTGFRKGEIQNEA